MCQSAAGKLFNGVIPIRISLPHEAILRAFNAQRSLDEQLSWFEYEMLIVEEKLEAASKQFESKMKYRMPRIAYKSVKANEKVLTTKINELIRSRWHTSQRQSQGDTDVTSLVATIPVPPTTLNCGETKAM